MPPVCRSCGHRGDWDSMLEDSNTATDGASATTLRVTLAEINDEIERFTAFSERYLAALADQQEATEEAIESCLEEQAAYPILSLPPEIMSRIFVECLPDDGVRPSSKRAPLRFMRVCRRWKDIVCTLYSRAVELPRHQGLPYIVPYIAEYQCSFAQLVYSRSRVSTLFDRCTDLACIPGIPSFIVRKKSSQYFPQSFRVPPGRMLDISRLEIVYHEDSLRWLVPANTSLPLLQCLRASFTDADLEDVLSNAPLLAELSWARPRTAGPAFPEFASNTLTKLDISSARGISAAAFLRILQNVPLLSDLACPVDARDIRNPQRRTFDNLLSLRLRQPPSIDFPPIHALQLLVAPNLRCLECDSSLEPDIFIPFMSEALYAIRELQCKIVDNDESDNNRRAVEVPRSEYSRLFPSVETLTISLETDIFPFER